MGIIDMIKNILGGDPHNETTAAAGAPEDTYIGTQLSTTGVVPSVATAATNPALRDVGADGVQAVSKPVEIEREQTPEARREDDVAWTRP